PTPDRFGVADEVEDRLHQIFTTDGGAAVVVPPGEHRIIVSRGYEYALFDQTITVAADESQAVEVVLARQVDSEGVMCADFHIHALFSPDSADTFERKVAGAVADGLEIPCSSEHEWVASFAPMVEQLGLEDWAFGMSASELTTFGWGHFGVVPLRPRPGALNQGAIDWIDRSPPEVFATIDELEEQPAVIVNHPRSFAMGYFSAALLRDDGTSTSELWSENFDAVEGGQP
ncbi:MAG: hypothetical protein AAGA56_28220, partial [Myxococcota bacterium]